MNKDYEQRLKGIVLKAFGVYAEELEYNMPVTIDTEKVEQIAKALDQLMTERVIQELEWVEEYCLGDDFSSRGNFEMRIKALKGGQK